MSEENTRTRGPLAAAAPPGVCWDRDRSYRETTHFSQNLARGDLTISRIMLLRSPFSVRQVLRNFIKDQNCKLLNGGGRRVLSFPGSVRFVKTTFRWSVPGTTSENRQNPISNFLKDRKTAPDADPPSDRDVNQLYQFFEQSSKLVVLTGAGISTESGIPDYRSPSGAYSTGFRPITHQDQLKALNPKWAEAIESLDDGPPGSDKSFGMKQRPDGDIEIDEKFWEEDFDIPVCPKCSGVLKPDVVFFGDNVPKDRADKAMEAAKGCDAFLVLGSSLMTMSAYRLVRAAHEAGAATAIINIGETRADDFVPLKINARLGEILPRVLDVGSLSIPAVYCDDTEKRSRTTEIE